VLGFKHPPLPLQMPRETTQIHFNSRRAQVNKITKVWKKYLRINQSKEQSCLPAPLKALSQNLLADGACKDCNQDQWVFYQQHPCGPCQKKSDINTVKSRCQQTRSIPVFILIA